MLETRVVLSTVTWDGGASTFNWSDPNNWSSDALPGSTDDVVVPDLSGTPTITSSAAVSIRSITSAEALSISGGSFSTVLEPVLNLGVSVSGGLFLPAGITNTTLVNVGVSGTVAVTGMPSDQLVGLWHGEGNAMDAAGTNNGTFVGGATTTSAGKVGSAFSFNGTSSYISTNTTLTTDQSFTLSAWVNWNGQNAQQFQEIFSFWSASNPGGDEIFLGTAQSGQGPLRFGDGWNNIPVNLPTGQWVHLAATYDGTTNNRQLYMNGALAASKNNTAQAGFNGTLHIGHQAANGEYWNGLIDEPAVFGRVLTPTEIQATMNGGTFTQTSGTTSVSSTLTTGSTNIQGGSATLGTSLANVLSLYKGEGNANDSSTSGINGAFQNGATTTTSGKIGSAFNFNGTTHYVNLGDNFDRGTSDFTIAVWIKGDPTMETWGRILDKGYSTGFALGRQSNTNKVEFEFLGSGSLGNNFTTTSTVIDNTWHHITVTKQGNTARIYADGKLENTETVTTSSQDNALPLYIGYNPGEGTLGHWKGQLDEITLLNRALSDSEIAALAAAPATKLSSTTLSVPAGKLSGTSTLSGTGTLTGSGPVNGALVNNSSVAPDGAAVITLNGNYTQGSTGALNVDISGPSAALSEYDQIVVNGTVTLGDPGNGITAGPLNVSFLYGYVAPAGTSFTIIDNDGTDPVSGTFSGLPEGAVIAAGSNFFRITYQGGTGNDVLLTTAVIWDGGGGDFSWSNPLNWNTDTLPTRTDAVVIPDLSGTPTITSSGTVLIYLLSTAEHLAITGGTFNVLHSTVASRGVTQSGGAFFSGAINTNTTAVTVNPGSTNTLTGVPANGLVALWHLDGNSSDVFGTNNSTGSNLVNYQSAAAGHGVKLSNTGFIDIADNTSLQFQQLSLSAWVRPDGPGTHADASYIISKADPTGTNSSLELGWSSNSKQFFFVVQGVGIGSGTFAAGSGFHHVAGTYDGSIMRLYVDGQLQSQAARTGTIPYHATVPWSIGSGPPHFRSGGYYRTLEGVIDEVAVHNRPLSATEILTSYQNRSYIQTAGTTNVGGTMSTGGISIQAGTATLDTRSLTGVVGLWRGDGNASDSSGNALNGATVGTATTSSSGKIGSAFSFPSSGDYISIPDDNRLDVTGDLTIGAWIYPTSTTGPQRGIFDKRNPDQLNVTYGLFLETDGRVAFTSRNSGGGFNTVYSATAVPANQYTHVVVTIQGSTLKFFLNGMESSSNNYPFVRPATVGATTIGGGSLIPLIDEPILFNRALSADEAANLASASFDRISGTTLTIPAGKMAGTLTVSGTGSLNGSGIVAGKLTNNATVAPGNTPGIITVNGNYEQSSNGTLDIEMTGPNSATADYDRLLVNGTVTLAGTLNISLSGFTPATGNTFNIIDNDGIDAISGTFSGLPEGTTFNIGTIPFRISYIGGTSNNDVVLTVLNANPTLVSITRQSPSGQITNAESVVFEVTFSEAVTGVNTNYLNDFSLSGPGAAGASLDNNSSLVTTIDNIHWLIPVVGLNSNGVVQLNLVSNTGIVDLDSTPLDTSVFTSGETYLRDTTVPSAAVTTSPQNVVVVSQSTSTRTVTITYTDANGIDASTFNDSNITVNHGATVTGISAVGNVVTYTITAQGSDWDHSFQGTYTIGLAASVRDVAGNAVASNANVSSFTVSTPPESTSINRAAPSTPTTNGTSVTYLVTFNEIVENVTSDDFVLPFVGTTGGIVGTPSSTDGGRTWSVPVSNLSSSSEGTVRLDLKENTDIADPATNALATASSGQEYFLDHTAPTLTSIARYNPASPFTNATSVSFRATFSEAVVNVSAGNFGLTGTAIAGGSIGNPSTGDGGVHWRITVTGLDSNANGTVQLDLTNNTNIADMATNTLETDELDGEFYTLDDASPTLISINRSSPAGEFTNGASVTFLATFSERVVGVTSDNFSLPFLASTEGVVGTPTASNGGLTWSIPVTNLSNSASGFVSLDLANRDNIADLASNELTNATPTLQSYTLDHVAPRLDSINRFSPAGQNTNSNTVTFLATFSEPVTNVNASHFSLPFHATTGGTIGNPSSGDGGLTWTIGVTDLGNANGSVELDLENITNIRDRASNSLTTTTFTKQGYSVNYTAPTLSTIARLSPTEEFTDGSSVTFLATFSDEVSGVTASNFSLPFSGITGGSIQTPSTNDGGLTWSIIVTGLGSSEGQVQLNLANNADIADLAGNALSTTSLTGQSYTLDHVAPTLATITRKTPTAQLINVSNVVFEVTFSEYISDLLAVFTTNFQLSGDAADGAHLNAPTTSDHIHWSFLVTSITHDGSLRLDLIDNSGITDRTAHVLETLSFTAGQSYNIDQTDPELDSIKRHTPTDENTGVSNVTFEVTFSEPVFGVDTNYLSKFSLSGPGSLAATFGAPTTTDNIHWLVSVTTQGANGQIKLNLVQNTGITDLVTNALTTSTFTSGESYTLSYAAPLTVYVDDDFTQVDGTTIADADLGTDGDQDAIVGITAFDTLVDALAVLASNGLLIVNDGTYSESATLSGTQTLRVTGDDTAQTVSIDTLTTATGQPVQLRGSSNLTIAGSADSSIGGVISGPGSLTKEGAGTLTLGATNTYGGATAVNTGRLNVNGSTAATSAVSVGSTGVLGGTGTISGAISVANGGTVSPGTSAGILNTSGLAFVSGAKFNVELNGTTAGTQYDQVRAGGAVVLAGATLNLSFGYTPSGGNQLKILDNASGNPVSGTFAGLAQGELFSAGGTLFQINYTGGDGDDVVLTAVYVVTTAADSGAGSLRQAILDANTEPGLNYIHFDIPSGPQTVSPASALPAVTDSLIIDGTTQPNQGSTALINLSNSWAVNAATEIRGPWQLSGGTLSGSAAITVSGALSWTGGTMSGAGTTTIAVGASLSIGSSTHTLGRTLNNLATATWTAGAMNFSTGGSFANKSGASFNSQANATWAAPFDNQSGATFNRSGSGTSTFSGTFSNSNEVNVDAGTLSLSDGGTDTGTYSVDSGTVLDFAGGTRTLSSNGSISGAGQVQFSGSTTTLSGSYNVSSGTTVSGGTATLNGTITNLGTTLSVTSGTANVYSNPATDPATVSISAGGSAAFEFSNATNPVAITTLTVAGTLGGSARIDVSGLVTWSGTITGAGILNANGGISMSGTPSLSDRTVNNAATAVLTGSQTFWNNGAVFNNLSGATFDLRDATTFTNDTGAAPELNNAGTLLRSTTAGTAVIPFSVNNTGTISVSAGTLDLSGGVTQKPATTLTGGTWNVSANSTLILPGTITANQTTVTLSGTGATFSALNSLSANTGTLSVLSGSTLTTSGALSNSGAMTVGTGATLAVTGNYSQSAGTTTVNGSLTSRTSTLSINGGTLSGAGTLTGNVTNAGTLSPGNPQGALTGSLTTQGNFTQSTGSAFNVEIIGENSTTPEFDQLAVSGTVTLNGALNISLLTGYVLDGGDQVTIVNNTGSQPVSGTFTGLNQNAAIFVGDIVFRISYTGGTGNDVVLTVIPDSALLDITNGNTLTYTLFDGSTDGNVTSPTLNQLSFSVNGPNTIKATTAARTLGFAASGSTITGTLTSAITTVNIVGWTTEGELFTIHTLNLSLADLVVDANVDVTELDGTISTSASRAQTFNSPETRVVAQNAALTASTVTFAGNVRGDGGSVSAGNSHALAITSNAVFSGQSADLSSLSVSGTTSLAGTDITTNAGNSGSGVQTYSGAVTIAGAVSLTSGTTGGAIRLLATVNGAFDLFVASQSQITFGGMVGGSVPLASLSTSGAGGTTQINTASVRTTGPQTYSQNVTLGATAAQSLVAESLPGAAGGTAALVKFAGTVTGNAKSLTFGSLPPATVDTTNVEFAGAVSAIGDLLVTGRTRFASGGGITLSSAGKQTFNGAVVIGAHTTLSTTALGTGGNITFGATVDDSVVGAHSLTINSAATIAFNATVGGANGTTALAALTTGAGGKTTLAGGRVTTTGAQNYGGGVDLLGSTVFIANTVPNGFNGTADSVTFAGMLKGNGGNATFGISGVPVVTDAVFNASVSDVAALTVTGKTELLTGASASVLSVIIATSGMQTYFGSVTLGNGRSVTLKSTGNGNVVFGSVLNGAADLIVDTLGSAQFSGTVGATTPLKLLTVKSGPANLAATGTSAIPTVSTTLGQKYAGAVTLGGATAWLKDTGSSIQFDGTLTGPSVPLTVSAANLVLIKGDVSVRQFASLGAVQLWANLTTSSASAIPVAQQFGGALTLSSSSILLKNNAASTSSIVFESTISGASNLTVEAGASTTGSTVFKGAVGSLTSLTVKYASELRGAKSVTTTGAQTYSGPVLVANDATLSSTTAGGTIDFQSSIDGGYALTTNVTTTAKVKFAGPLGLATPLSSLVTSKTGGGIEFGVSGSSNVTVVTTGSQIYEQNVTLLSAGTTTFIANADPGQTGTASVVRFTGTVNGADNGNLTLGAATSPTNVEFGKSLGVSGALTHVTVRGNTQFMGTGVLAVTTAGAQWYTGALRLATAVTITAGAAQPVTFTGAVDGTFALVVNTTGTTTFAGAVGGSEALLSLTTNADGTTILEGGRVLTRGLQAYGDDVTIGTLDAVLGSSSGAAITFNGSLSGPRGLTVNTTGTTTFGGVVGAVPLSFLTTNAGGLSKINGGTVATSGDQTFGDAVTILVDSVLTGVNVTFADALRADTASTSSALSVVASGITTFGGTVGSTKALTSLTTDAVGSTRIAGSTVTTTGSQSFNDALKIGATATLLSSGNSSIAFAKEIDALAAGTFGLTVNTAGVTTFGGVVGGSLPFATLTTNAGGTTVFNTASIRTTGAQTFGDVASLSRNLQVIAGITGAGQLVRFAGTLSSANAATLTVGSSAIPSNGAFEDNVGSNAAPLGAVTVYGAMLFGAATGGAATVAVTTDATQWYRGPVTLNKPTTIDATSSASADVLFDGKLDSPSGKSLILNLAGGDVTFSGAVGQTSPLGGLSISDAAQSAGTTFLGGGLAVSSGAQTYGQAVSLQKDTVLTAGTLLVTFQQAIAGNGYALQVGESSRTTPARFESDAVGVSTLTTNGAAQFGSSGGDAISISSSGIQAYRKGATLLQSTSLTTGDADVSFGGPVDGTTDDLETLTIEVGTGNAAFTGIVGGTKSLGALRIVSAQHVTFSSAVTVDSLQQDAGTGTTTLGKAVTTHNAHSTAGLNLQTAAITIGANAAILVDGGGAATLNNTSGLLTIGLGASITADGDVKQTGSGISSLVLLGGNITSTGGGIDFKKGVTITRSAVLSAAANQPIRFQGTVDSASNGAYGLTVNTSGVTTFGGAVGTALGKALSMLKTDGGGTVSLPNVTTTGAQTYDDNTVLLTGSAYSLGTSGVFTVTSGVVTLSAVSTTIAAGGNIQFGNAIQGTANGAQSLLLNSAGTTKLSGAVGTASVNLAALTTDARGTTIFLGGTIRTTGDQHFGDAFNVAADCDLYVSGVENAVVFDGSISGANADLSIHAQATFGSSGTQTVAGVASLVVDRAARINVKSITTSATQTWSGAVLVQSATTLVSTGAGNLGDISFAGTVNSGINGAPGGAFSLTVNTAGATTFALGVGNSAPLSMLKTDAAGSTELNGGLVSTTGAQTYGDDVTLGGAPSVLTVSASSVTFSKAVDGPRGLAVNSAGAVQFLQPVGANVPLASLTTNAGGTTQLKGGAVTTGSQSWGDALTVTGGMSLTATGADSRVEIGTTLKTSGANLTITADTGGIDFQGAVQVTGNLTLELSANGTGTGHVTQTAGGSITAFGLELLGTGNYDLTSPSNKVKLLAGDVTGNVSYVDSVSTEIGSVNTAGLSASGTLRLKTGKSITQSQPISSTALQIVTGAGTLTNAANDVGLLSGSLSGALAFVNAATSSLTLRDIAAGPVGMNATSGLTAGSLSLSALSISVESSVNQTDGKGTVILTAQPTGVLAVSAPIQAQGPVNLGGGLINLGSNLSTSGDAITFNSPVRLTPSTDVSLDTTQGGAGGHVVLNSTLGGNGLGRNLNIKAGAGKVTFVGAVGANLSTPGDNALGHVVIQSALDVVLPAGGFKAASLTQLAGTGKTTIGGPLTTSSSTGVVLTTRNVEINGTVSAGGTGPITITNSGLLALNVDIGTAGGAVTLQKAASSLGTLVAAADITTAGGNLTLDEPVTLGVASVVFDASGGSGTLQFKNSLGVASGKTLNLASNSPAQIRSLATLGTTGAAIPGRLVASAGVAVMAGGTLTGNGVVTGPLFLNGGTLSPGAANGSLTLNNASSFTGGAGSTFAVIINGAFPNPAGLATGYDFLNTGGNDVDLTGVALSVSLKSGFVPAVGAVFRILAAQTLPSGTFVNLPDNAPITIGNYTFRINYSNTGVTLTRVTMLPVGAPNGAIAELDAELGSTVLENNATVSFGDLLLNSAGSTTRTITINNSGAAALALGSLLAAAPRGFSTSYAPQSVPAGGAISFTITLDTRSTGLFSGALSFLTNDAASSPFKINLLGSVSSFPIADSSVSSAQFVVPAGPMAGTVTATYSPAGSPEVGTWQIAAAGFLGNSRVSSGAANASWEFSGLNDLVRYAVYATWQVVPGASGASYSLVGATTANVPVAQTSPPTANATDAGSSFKFLGTLFPSGGRITITLSGNNISADAVRLTPAPQLAIGGRDASQPTSDRLTSVELQRVVDTALAQLAGTDLGRSHAAELASTRFVISDLPEGFLGEQSGATSTIYIDQNAAGYGWFVDVSPAAFTQRDSHEWSAIPESRAFGRMDLLTVVEHELGHVLGLGSFDPSIAPHSLMSLSLPTGTRRLPRNEFDLPSNATQTPASVSSNAGSARESELPQAAPTVPALTTVNMRPTADESTTAVAPFSSRMPVGPHDVLDAASAPSVIVRGNMPRRQSTDVVFSLWNGDEFSMWGV